jgi:septal ring factor EnvC (AmiA/AmiB activator)
VRGPGAASVTGSLRPRRTVPFAVVLAALAMWAALPLPAASQGERSLRERIDRSERRERQLGGAVQRLDRLVARTAREVGVVQGRLTEVEGELASAAARLAATRAELAAERERLARNRRRLASSRRLLAAQLLADYKGHDPSLATLVLGASSFADLLAQVEYVKRVEERNAVIVDRVRRWRDEARRRSGVLARLEAAREQDTQAVRRRRDALAVMRDGLAAREATLQRARAARAQALAGTRAGRLAAERELRALVRERERAAAEAASAAPTRASGPSPGPGGPWAIPWPIVQCESGGQNLTPNAAGASGYYQMMPDTWAGLGGSTPHAYQASKAEQDRLAARLWAGGRGARNWVCAALV